MSRRYEDFDEFCDPENPRAIMFDDVLAAAERIAPYIRLSSCVPSHFQHQLTMYLYHKLEISHITGSFKERGIINALLCLPLDKKKTGALVASNGNEALAFTHFAAKLNIPAYVVATNTVPTNVLQTCYSNGAKVYVQGNTLAETMRFARGIAREKKLAYINGRDHPNVLAGYGTIAIEILEQLPAVDAIIVPVGTGGLVSAVASIVKRIKPKCFVYGVQAENSPVFFNHLAEEETSVKMDSTIATSINVPTVGTNAIFNARPLVDKMLLVRENWIARSVLHYYEKEHYVVEGAAACPLAAIIGNIAPELKMKHVVCIVTGGNVNPFVYTRIIQRALAAEGNLVKFRVSVPQGTNGIYQLHRLLGAAGYNVVDMRPDKECLTEDVFLIKVRVVCETKGMDHSLELKRIMDRAYPFLTVFKNEPFSDNRACPCYIRKHSNYL